MSFLALDPDAVAGAGRATAATESDWTETAERAETALRNAASEAQESTVTAAIEGYLSQLNPTMKAVARQVDALGTNTVSAANTITNSDSAASALLGARGAATEHGSSALRRPIGPG